jgi:hypothetical protein
MGSYLEIKLTKKTTLVLGQSLNRKGGFASGIKMITVLNQVTNNVVETKKMIKTMLIEINKLRKIVGLCVESHLRQNLI